jgi:glycosyltransferase involved in cell wall biosynthesis
LYVSRISCRKGVDLIVGLSHRLRDLAGDVKISIIGGHTQWSDYRRALKDLDPTVATYLGYRPAPEVLARYHTADALLVPSRYEPGSLVVGEALAGGIPVVASDEVGPSEVVDATCMRRFPAGDLDAFERAVRNLLPDLRSRFPELSSTARAEAERWFAPELISRQLELILREAAALRTTRGSRRPKLRISGSPVDVQS